ncbi:hypothetical protein AAGW05_16735 [Arthrobacter sp. LAPM80]|uniref:hypothetical protein n=1 Tax=Arthrobacter sp. LAPM80 TaxID=3141788 RepID=UPI00398A6846
MITSTITAATAAVQTAIDNHTAAIAKARQAAMDAVTATRAAASLDARLRSGDASVSAEEIIDTKASAERLALLAGAYNDALPSIEHGVRLARTAETVAMIRAGAIRSREQDTEFVAALAAGIADQLEALRPELQAEAEARAVISEGLPDTTADSPERYRFPDGEPSSLISVGRGADSFEVDGVVYSAGLDVQRTMERITEEAVSILTNREHDRDESTRAAASARIQTKYREQQEFARREREGWSHRPDTSAPASYRPGTLQYTR